MKKIMMLLALGMMANLTSISAVMLDSTNPSIKPIDLETFTVESNLIADQMDSLMTLHVFKYSKSSLPKNYDSTYVPVFADSIYELRMAALDAASPLEFTYNPIVRRYIDLYTERRREQVGRMLGLGKYYFPMFEEVLDRYNMPLELKYLAVVESALNPLARSRVGATGLWQFMYGTGKLMGLKANSYADERSDPMKSTVAACEYMTRLYKTFGDWNLVLAAYNSGPGNVNKAIRRSGGKTSYWELRNYLPRETAGYVPAFIAATYAMTYAKEHNLYATREVPHFGNVDTILVRQQISFDQLNLWLGIDKEIVEFLNPQYKLGIIPNLTNQPQYLVLPRQAMGLFIQNEDSLYIYAEAFFEKNKSEMPSTATQERTVHRVKKGESLGLIANKYGVSVSKIKQWNGLRTNTIRIDQRLTIYSNNAVAETKKAAPPKVTTENGNTYYVVQKGDTLYDIAKRFPGVSSDNLSEWNNVNGNNIQPGMKLVVQKSSSSN